MWHFIFRFVSFRFVLLCGISTKHSLTSNLVHQSLHPPIKFRFDTTMGACGAKESSGGVYRTDGNTSSGNGNGNGNDFTPPRKTMTPEEIRQTKARDSFRFNNRSKKAGAGSRGGSGSHPESNFNNNYSSSNNGLLLQRTNASFAPPKFIVVI